MRLLVTRPDPDAQRTAADLRSRGHEVHVAAVLRIESTPARIGEGPWAAVLMTSANAARSASGHPALAELRRLPVFTVGRHTAEAAREAGFVAVASADGNAADLAHVVARRFRGEQANLLYLSGEETAFDLAAALQREGFHVCSAAIYRSVAADQFPPEVTSLLQERGFAGVLHFSRRSAQAYVSCASRCGALEPALEPLHYCLSPAVAAVLTDAGASQVSIAPRPHEAALLSLIG
jgi:uroporphyrinogen-III synthase